MNFCKRETRMKNEFSPSAPFELGARTIAIYFA